MNLGGRKFLCPLEDNGRQGVERARMDRVRGNREGDTNPLWVREYCQR